MEDYFTSVVDKFSPIPPTDKGTIKSIKENFKLNDNIILIEKEKKGLILGIVYPYIFNPQILIAQELGWWVEPEYRGTTVGVRLLKEFELQARKKGANKIIMASLHNEYKDKLASIYNKLGYAPLEYMYIKDL